MFGRCSTDCTCSIVRSDYIMKEILLIENVITLKEIWQRDCSMFTTDFLHEKTPLKPINRTLCLSFQVALHDCALLFTARRVNTPKIVYIGELRLCYVSIFA